MKLGVFPSILIENLHSRGLSRNSSLEDNAYLDNENFFYIFLLKIQVLELSFVPLYVLSMFKRKTPPLFSDLNWTGVYKLFCRRLKYKDLTGQPAFST